MQNELNQLLFTIKLNWMQKSIFMYSLYLQLAIYCLKTCISTQKIRKKRMKISNQDLLD